MFFVTLAELGLSALHDVIHTKLPSPHPHGVESIVLLRGESCFPTFPVSQWESDRPFLILSLPSPGSGALGEMKKTRGEHGVRWETPTSGRRQGQRRKQGREK